MLFLENCNSGKTTATEIGEDILANELSQLNFIEKQQIDEEIHGITRDGQYGKSKIPSNKPKDNQKQTAMT